MNTELPTYQHELRPLTSVQINQLLADLNPARIMERGQGNSKLSYLAAWDVKAMLTRVFGFGGWSADVIPEGTKILRMDHDIPALEYNPDRKAPKVQKTEPDGSPIFNWRVTAQATMRLHIHQLGATYSEVGIASQTGPDVGEVGDFAIKTAESDALKRCAINLGTAFGLSLYDNGATADVVQRVIAPGQRMRDRVLLAAAEAVENLETDIAIARAKLRFETLTAELAQIQGEAPAAPPAQQRAVAPPADLDGGDAPASPESVAAAQASVQAAFGGETK